MVSVFRIVCGHRVEERHFVEFFVGIFRRTNFDVESHAAAETVRRAEKG